MHRLASGEVDVELETQAELNAEQALAQGDRFNFQDPGNAPIRSPHNSSRSIHASSHNLAAPGGAGRLSYNSEGDHAVRRLTTMSEVDVGREPFSPSTVMRRGGVNTVRSVDIITL